MMDSSGVYLLGIWALSEIQLRHCTTNKHRIAISCGMSKFMSYVVVPRNRILCATVCVICLFTSAFKLGTIKPLKHIQLFLSLRPPMLAEAENFTVLIKNNIRYPKFNFNK